MKPLKIAVSDPSPPVSLNMKTIFKKTGARAKTATKSENQPPEFILVPTEHLTAAQRTKLLVHGLSFKPQDNILRRLMQLEKENRHLKSLSVTDELTGIYNKRFFNRQMSVEIARTQRTGEPFCLLFIDLDNFKTVNDTLGHAKGDEFLVKVCHQINMKIRPTDFACRFGGDEFAIILPTTHLRDGITCAKRWHALILQIAVDMELPVSSSIGVDAFTTSCKLNAQEFLNQVDQLLYKAKGMGKGRICHPDVDIPESKAITRTEKEILYHIFQPSRQKKFSEHNHRGKN
jgi:diguanylate cyclase (GGDEF)-like protein